MTQRHIGIIFDDGWKNARNFIYSGFIDKILNSCKVTIFSRHPNSSAFSVLPSEVNIQPLQLLYEPPFLRKFRKILVVYHNAILSNIGYHKWSHTYVIDNKYNLLQKIFSKFGKFILLRLLSLMEYKLGRILGTDKNWKYIYNKMNIDTLLVSYQSDSILSALQTAVNVKLKTFIIPLSWKDIFAFPHIKIIPSHYILWSKDILYFYKLFNPWINTSIFKVIGSLYLEPYKSRADIIKRERFFQETGLDQKRPYICYTAAAKKAVLHEDKIVHEILNAIKTDKIKNNPQLLLRLNPLDSNNQFSYLSDLFPSGIIFQKPKWEISQDWACPVPDDNTLWMSTIFYSNLNISIPSTASLEFISMDKPVVNICFDYPEEIPYHMSNRRYWEADFYQEAKKSELINPSYNMDSLTKNINDKIYNKDTKCDIPWINQNPLTSLIKLITT